MHKYLLRTLAQRSTVIQSIYFNHILYLYSLCISINSSSSISWNNINSISLSLEVDKSVKIKDTVVINDILNLLLICETEEILKAKKKNKKDIEVAKVIFWYLFKSFAHCQNQRNRMQTCRNQKFNHHRN